MVTPSFFYIHSTIALGFLLITVIFQLLFTANLTLHYENGLLRSARNRSKPVVLELLSFTRPVTNQLTAVRCSH